MKLSRSVISGVTIPLSLRWAASQTSPTAAWQTRRADDVNVTSQSSSANWGGGVRITPAANNKKTGQNSGKEKSSEVMLEVISLEMSKSASSRVKETSTGLLLLSKLAAIWELCFCPFNNDHYDIQTPPTFSSSCHCLKWMWCVRSDRENEAVTRSSHQPRLPSLQREAPWVKWSHKWKMLNVNSMRRPIKTDIQSLTAGSVLLHPVYKC